jgi:hypothetical protein
MRKLTVVLVAVAFVLGFSLSAMAAQGLVYTSTGQLPVGAKSIDVYGSIRMETYNLHTSGQASSTGYNDDVFNWLIDDSSSRFGVRFNEGKIGAQVEIRPRDRQSNRTRELSVGGQMDLMRLWYGTYDLGWGKFLIGQDWTPSFNPICNECLVGGGGILDGYGDMGGSARAPQLRMDIPISFVNGLLKVAAITPWTDTGPSAHSTTQIIPAWGTAFHNDTSIPKLEASLGGAFGPLAFTLRGGYNTYDMVNNATNDSESVSSYLGALDLTYSFGPFYLRGEGYLAQNISVYGTGAPEIAMGLFPQAFTGSDIENVDNYGFFGVAGFRLNDMFAAEAGYGQRHSKLSWLSYGDIKEDTSAWVVFFPISITPSFVITPEFLYTAEGSIDGPSPAAAPNGPGNGVTYGDRGNHFYAGIYWRIDF